MNKNLFLIITILLLSLSRLLPHIPNFTPILACALFSGATFNSRKISILILIGSMFLSDCLIEFMYGYGFHNLMITIYLIVLSINLLGSKLKNSITKKRVMLFSVLGSIIFFLFSNLFVFLGGEYGYSLAGLQICYIAAIPFLGYSMLGDLFYNFLLFGSYYWVFKKSININKSNLWN